MKLLILVSFLGAVACRTAPLYPRIEELVRYSTSVEHLYNETVLLISLTEQIMTRMITSGRGDIDTSLTTIDSSLDAVYQYSTNRTRTIASYLLDEITTLQAEVPDLEICLSIVPEVQGLSQEFDDQFKVVFSSAYYIANTTLENKYTGLLENIAHVHGLPPILENCNLDEECIVDVANQVEEQNLALINGLNDISSSTTTIFDQVLTVANASAERTLYVDEEYICNVATIIENCIRSRIDNPIVTTTPSAQPTSPIPVTETTSGETTPAETTPAETTPAETTVTPGTTEAPVTDSTTFQPTTSVTAATTLNPDIYCNHQNFSP